MAFSKIERKFDGLKVLVVDDYIVNQDLCQKMLELMGCQVQVADNGRHAVEVFQSGDFDIVLMDIMMPELDGYQATAEIRELEKSTGVHTQIIALTANALSGDKEKCLASGMDNYVSKPIRMAALEEVISACVVSSQ